VEGIEDWLRRDRCADDLPGELSLEGQVQRVREWYEPQLERLYDASQVRAGDLLQLERLSASCESREAFLTEMALDPPSATSDLSGAPYLDEDYLILSTVHSAKGQEWDAVHVLNVTDGNFPSEFATGKPELIEEERRLLYVAMTRAKSELHCCSRSSITSRSNRVWATGTSTARRAGS